MGGVDAEEVLLPSNSGRCEDVGGNPQFHVQLCK